MNSSDYLTSKVMITISLLLEKKAGIGKLLCKGQMVSILGSVGHMVTVVTTQP